MEDIEETRGQFTFYLSFFEAISKIKKKADRADAYDAICTYALYNKQPDLEKLSDAAVIAFMLIKPNLDASRKKAKSGKRGGAKAKSETKPQANRKQTESKQKANTKLEENAREKEKEEEKEIEKENECYISPNPPLQGGTPPQRFSKPSVDDVKSYCQEHGYTVDAERFVDYYTANGWRVGKNPMKDWKAAVRTWVRQSGEYSRQQPVSRKQTKAEELDDFYRMAANWANEGENA